MVPGLWCGVWSSRGCHTRSALQREDFHQRIRDFMTHIPTLRKVVFVWARCWVSIPTRIIGVDLDNLPHSINRPGDTSDGWGNPNGGYYYW